MQVIFKNTKRSHGSAVHGSNSAIARVLSGLLMMAAAFYIGKEYGAARQDGWASTDTGWFLSRLSAGRGAVENVKGETDGRLHALMLRLGQLQSQMLRLNAVGQRVVEKLNVDSAEFDFSEPSGMGGPQSDSVNRVMAVLSRDMAHRGVQLRTLDSMLTDHALKKEIVPAGNPVKNGHLSSKYGWRVDPFSGRRKFHHGVDLAATRGSEVVAAASGLVTWSGKRGGYGKLVEITHGDGYVTRYGHSAKVLVEQGAMVRRGQPIARVGSTGRSTGPHLHYEVLLNGKKVNPTKYIKASL